MLDRATRKKLVIQSVLKQFKEEKQMPMKMKKIQRNKEFIYQDMYHVLGQIAEVQSIIDAAEEAEEKKDELECRFIKLMDELQK